MRRRPPAGTAASVAACLLMPFAVTALAVPGARAATTINEPPVAPHVVNVFPQRDFVSAGGYGDGQLVTVELSHDGTTWFTAGSGLAPQDDPRTPAFDGLVEVNHPGGYCWQGTTPNIRPGDEVRVTVDATGVADQTTVAAVKAQRPVQTAPDTVVVHGSAAAGTDITQLEHRLVANRQAFDLNGTRALRASSVAARRAGGTLAYDAGSTTGWTATYSGLTVHDVTMALGAESVGLWLGQVPGNAVESTSYEVGAGIAKGPTAPCTAPAEVVPPAPGSDQSPPSTPERLTAGVTGNSTVTLTWPAATDDVGVTGYGIYRDGTPIDNVQNPDGSAPAPTTYVDKNVTPGDYVYSVDAADANGNRSGQVRAAPVTTVANPAAAVPVDEPPTLPVSIISFPSRDFISSSGFLPTDSVDVAVIRDGKVISTATGQIPQDDEKTAGFDGLVEVNHPGGGCWEGVTPEIRPGDVVRTVAYDAAGSVRTVDQTRTSDVTATRVTIVRPATTATSKDGEITITGTAMGADGRPLPIDQIEQRLVANRDAFDATGKRTVRAGGAGGTGAMSYDTVDNPTGEKWTTTYTGLSSDDVYRAAGGTSLTGRTFAGAESRVLWLGVNPLSGQEITIFEVGLADPPGPVAGFCTAPLEKPDSAAPSVPTGVTATQSAPTDVTLRWTASTDDWYVAGYRISRDGTPIATVGGGFAKATDTTSAFTVPTVFVDRGVPAGAHSYTVAAFDDASPLGAGATDVARVGAGIGKPYGNVSAPSAAATLSQHDVTAPSVPGNVTAKVTGQDVTLGWGASTDDVGVSAYRVYRRAAGTTSWAKQGADVTAGTAYTDTAVAAGSYEYAVDAVDAAGNTSAKSDPPAAVTVTATADTTPPSDVTGLAATNAPDVHGTDVQVSWNAATDDVAVSGYGVYRDGTRIADVSAPGLSYLDTRRSAGTYAYTVDAVDSAGNRSVSRPAAVSVTVANDPPLAPHALIAFPQRDFISATGYTPGTPYTFSVLRTGTVVAGSTPVTADATGLVEVNHPGGACWNTVTPDIRPGDVVRITGGGISEQTTVPGVTAERPIVTAVDTVTGGGTVEIHGTAQDSAGKPLPVDQLEQRLVANRDAFDLTGRRTVRAGGAGADGTLSYDAAGSVRWTARYAFQTPNDLARAVGGTSTSGAQFTGAESRILWLGRAPLAGVEQTIYENGPGVTGGPAAGILGCTSGPAEVAAGAALSPAPTFAVTDVGATSAPQTVRLTNAGSAPLKIDRAYLAGLHPGDFTLTVPAGVNGGTVAPGASVSVTVALKPTAAGSRQANVSFADDAANTTDQSVTLTGSTPAAATAPTATAPVQSLAAGQVVKPLSPLANSTLAVDLRWTGTGTRSELQMATGNGPTTLGPFTDVGGFATADRNAATSTTVGLTMGGTTGRGYQFQSRSCAGSTCSAWVKGPAFTLLAADDQSMAAAAFKSTWTSEALPGSYGGTVRWTAGSATATVVQSSFTVSGNAAWISTLGPDRGLAQVQVDGGAAQQVDLYSPTVQPARVVWARDALPAGTHTVTVTVIGKKSPLNPGACSTGTKCARVDVDGAVIIK